MRYHLLPEKADTNISRCSNDQNLWNELVVSVQFQVNRERGLSMTGTLLSGFLLFNFKCASIHQLIVIRKHPYGSLRKSQELNSHVWILNHIGNLLSMGWIWLSRDLQPKAGAGLQALAWGNSMLMTPASDYGWSYLYQGCRVERMGRWGAKETAGTDPEHARSVLKISGCWLSQSAWLCFFHALGLTWHQNRALFNSRGFFLRVRWDQGD